MVQLKWVAALLWAFAALVFAHAAKPFDRDEVLRRAVGVTGRAEPRPVHYGWLSRVGAQSQRFLPPRLNRWLANATARAGGRLTLDAWRGTVVLTAAAGATLLLVAGGPPSGRLSLDLWAGIWRVLAGGMAGLSVTLGVLHFLVVSRTTRLSHDLPVLADLLLLGLEGGLGLDCALDEAGRLLSGPLREELAEVERLKVLGVPRTTALREMGVRLAIPDLSGFVNLLSQAEALGCGLTRAVTATAGRFRTARVMEAERLAGVAPVKMLFPLVFCLFPSILVLLLGPILIRRGGILL